MILLVKPGLTKSAFSPVACNHQNVLRQMDCFKFEALNALTGWILTIGCSDLTGSLLTNLPSRLAPSA